MQKSENKYFIFDRPKKYNFKFFLKYVCITILNFFYHVWVRIGSPKETSKTYTVSICAIFKNEGPYLFEWIEFCRTIGIDHFYLYNNNSTDDFLNVLQPYIESKVVTLIDWPQRQGQIAAYQDCIKNFSSETNWLGFIDIDEFIVPIHDNNIKTYLKKFSRYPSVKLYWQVFGTSGYVERNIKSSILSDFIVCWRKHDEVGKCFYNTAFKFKPNIPQNKGLHHSLWGTHNGINIPPVNCFGAFSNRGIEKATTSDFPIQVNHYFTKSFNEYIQKTSKGDVYYKKNPHTLAYFYRHEMYCGKVDYSAYKYLLKVKQVLMGN